MNTWNPTAMFKLIVLARNTWNHTTMSKLFVLDRNTWYITVQKSLTQLPKIYNERVFLISRYKIILDGIDNT